MDDEKGSSNGAIVATIILVMAILAAIFYFGGFTAKSEHVQRVENEQKENLEEHAPDPSTQPAISNPVPETN